MTLTEFLLERIAEDEAELQEYERRWEAKVSGDDHVLFTDEEYMGVWIPPERVLAECQAKRRIVERALRLQEGQQLGMRYVWQCLADLAAPYAGHSAYDPAWRANG
jgi:hypothetical protein